MATGKAGTLCHGCEEYFTEVFNEETAGTYCRECYDKIVHMDCDDHPCADCESAAIDRVMDAEDDYELYLAHPDVIALPDGVLEIPEGAFDL